MWLYWRCWGVCEISSLVLPRLSPYIKNRQKRNFFSWSKILLMTWWTNLQLNSRFSLNISIRPLQQFLTIFWDWWKLVIYLFINVVISIIINCHKCCHNCLYYHYKEDNSLVKVDSEYFLCTRGAEWGSCRKAGTDRGLTGLSHSVHTASPLKVTTHSTEINWSSIWTVDYNK